MHKRLVIIQCLNVKVGGTQTYHNVLKNNNTYMPNSLLLLKE